MHMNMTVSAPTTTNFTIDIGKLRVRVGSWFYRVTRGLERGVNEEKSVAPRRAQQHATATDPPETCKSTALNMKQDVFVP